MIPSRWPRSLVWLLAVPGGALVGLVLLALPKYRDLGLVGGVAAGAGAGLVVALLILIMTWRSARRIDRVQERQPESVIIGVAKSAETTAALVALGALPTGSKSRSMAVAFSVDGARFYSGSGQDDSVPFLERAEITGVDRGTAKAGSRTVAAVELVVREADGHSRTVPLIPLSDRYLYVSAGQVRVIIDGLLGAGLLPSR